MEHLSGWLTVLGILVSSVLYFQNKYNPQQSEDRVSIHCAAGKVTLLPLIWHITRFPFTGFNELGIWSAVGLIFITIGTGVILSYIPDAGNLRFHARSLHPALLVGIVIAVLHHILLHTGFL